MSELASAFGDQVGSRGVDQPGQADRPPVFDASLPADLAGSEVPRYSAGPPPELFQHHPRLAYWAGTRMVGTEARPSEWDGQFED